MHKELKEKILAFNRARKAEGEKASDLDLLVEALLKLPSGQLKKVMTSDILSLLEKYGMEGGDINGA